MDRVSCRASYAPLSSHQLITSDVYLSPNAVAFGPFLCVADHQLTSRLRDLSCVASGRGDATRHASPLRSRVAKPSAETARAVTTGDEPVASPHRSALQGGRGFSQGCGA